MQLLPTLAVAAMAAVQLLPVTRSESVLVRSVLDGDTIDVAQYGRVRLLGIDAPETGRGFDTPAPFGHEARERLASLVLHHWVRLEFEGPTLDVYNRHLAYVMREDGIFVNAALVRDGLARVSARTPLVRLSELKNAEAEAQRLRRGMWGAVPLIPPTRYTAESSSRDRPRAKRVRSPRVKPPSRKQPNKPRTTVKKKKKT
jgi:endonuclease YncB( thermonuclease family)